MYESMECSGRPEGGRIGEGKDGGNAEGQEGRGKIGILLFNVDSNHQQCESRETVVNLFMQAVFTDDGG